MKITAATLSLLLPIGAASATAADISVRVQNLPPEGTLVLQVYDDPDAFGNFRDPAREERFAIQPGETYVIRDVPAGEVALLAYVDKNNNRALDRNFIGIPVEPVGLSKKYQPKGPPSFQQASFSLAGDGTASQDIELYSILGESGQWGVGLGVIGRSSPYLGSDSSVIQPIPAITYLGERLQWVGPYLRYGILGSGDLRLALTASYRVGAYEEDDADILEGLGDRDSTLMAGLGLVYDGPNGFEFDLGYKHDVLDQIGGGTAVARVSRGFQFGRLRLAPELGVNWLSSELADYDYGVPASAAIPGRPAYSVGDSFTVEVGVGGLYELTRNWRVILAVAAEELDSDITDSPIVEDDRVIKGFAAITYAF
ncbi:MipA/OmpV family protein [Microbulbifer yueqingensis]|uniref:Outer membrane protein n=1 Tax=Microbulbifer yueqingensis TaxID=658219 RepID=A0A1G9AEW2_9GAMM|nr:MipA/OmpV family protein [Microbulbifer yueqingensis]SDK25374.1 outer membrane protein [Microbulbifer yueqingensis]